MTSEDRQQDPSQWDYVKIKVGRFALPAGTVLKPSPNGKAWQNGELSFSSDEVLKLVNVFGWFEVFLKPEEKKEG